MAPTIDEIKDGTGGWNGLEVDMSGYHFHFAHTQISNQQSVNQQGVVGRNQFQTIEALLGRHGTVCDRTAALGGIFVA